jgi:prepilin-type N-terminal cleavage/methylation domain-containing protein
VPLHPTQSCVRRGRCKNCQGFTLVEIMMAIGIIAIISIVSSLVLVGRRGTTDLTSTTQEITALLREAQSRSATQLNGATWGTYVGIATSGIPFYALYATSFSPTNTVGYYPFPPDVKLTTPNTNVTFSPKSGIPSASTSITIELVPQGIYSTITISSLGLIAYSTTTTTTAPGGNGQFGQFMQIAQTYNSGGGNSSVSVSFSSNNTAGNLIIVSVDWWTEPGNATSVVTSVTDSNGNAYTNAVGPIYDASPSGNQLWYAKNINGGANTVTVHFSPNISADEGNSGEALQILEYAGLNTSTPLDATSSMTGIGTSVHSDFATTHFANELIFGYGNSGPEINPGAGFTERLNSGAGESDEDMTVTSIGSYQAIFSADFSVPWAALLATFH